MPIPILMPALSPTMTEGNIATWTKKIGDTIKPGDIIAEVETDKATMEVESIDEGKLGSILYQNGAENVPVNSLIGVISLENETDEDINKFVKGYQKDKTNGDSIVDPNDIEQEAKEENTPTSNSNQVQDKTNENIISNEVHKKKEEKNNVDNNYDSKNIFISPLAKRIAEKKNIKLDTLKGSGPHGRIVKKDLDEYLLVDKPNIVSKESYNSNLNNVSEEKLSNVRKTIALRLQESKQTIPHFYLKTKINVDSLVRERKNINDFLMENNKESSKISLNDIFIKATAEALSQVPEMNATWNNDSIKKYSNVDISVAVATENGLFTPVVKNANNKKLTTISDEMKMFIDKAKGNKLMPEDYQGGSFSISNLGMFDIEEFSAIINPPQSGILAIGGIKEELKLEDSKVVAIKTISVTLSVDHRIADGATASKLLKCLNFYINNPIGMLI